MDSNSLMFHGADSSLTRIAQFHGARARAPSSPARCARALRDPSSRISRTATGLASTCGAARADRLQMRVERLRQLRLHLDVADLAGTVARLQVLDLGGVRVERVVVHEHRVAFDRARDVGADALRVRVHLHALSSSPSRRRPRGRWCCRSSCSSCGCRGRAAAGTSSAAAAARRTPRRRSCGSGARPRATARGAAPGPRPPGTNCASYMTTSAVCSSG